MRNQWRSKAELLRMQEKKFRAITHYAYENVKLYREKFKLARITPSDIRTLNDIRKIPLLTKEEAKTKPLHDRMSRAISVKHCTISRTSGSTGEPLIFAVDDKSSDFVRAYHLRRFAALGVRPWDKMLFLGSSRRSIVTGNIISEPAGRLFLGVRLRRLLSRRVRFLPIDLNFAEQLRYLNLFQPTFMLGPPSYFNLVTRATDEGRCSLHPKMILTWGEILDRATRQRIRSSFGAEVFDGYGSAESAPIGGLAWECPRHMGMHINIGCVVLEFLKDGESVSAGEKGEIVVTALHRFATPMIRYRLGDVGVFSDELCACGRNLPLLKGLEGRIVDFLSTPDGRVISPYAVFQLMEHIPGISKFKVIQDKHDRIIVVVEKGIGFSNNTSTELNHNFRNIIRFRGYHRLLFCRSNL